MTAATITVPDRLVELMGRHWTGDMMRWFVERTEAEANEGGLRGAVRPHGVLWLVVVAHGTEVASPAAEAVLDAAHAAGRVTFTDDGATHGSRLSVSAPSALPCGHSDRGRPCSVCAAFAAAADDEPF